MTHLNAHLHGSCNIYLYNMDRTCEAKLEYRKIHMSHIEQQMKARHSLSYLLNGSRYRRCKLGKMAEYTMTPKCDRCKLVTLESSP